LLGKKREVFITFVSFSFTLDFAIVSLLVLAFVVLGMASASKVNDDVQALH
jgi:hypothetical protein